MGRRFTLILLGILLSSACINSIEPSFANYNPTFNETVKNDFSEYMNNLQLKLKKNWITPDFMENGHVRVLFKIDKSGNVIAGTILESSGNALYDESAVNAIHKSEPFGDFPQNSTRETLTINYTFDTTLIKTEKIKELYELAKKYSYTDRKLALEYIDQAIDEVGTDIESYFLYKRRALIKDGLGDHIGAKNDLDKYKELKAKADIKRIHALKYYVEHEDTSFAYYYLAFAYEQIEDYQNAIAAIDKAIERTDLNAHYKRYRETLINLMNNKVIKDDSHYKLSLTSHQNN